MDCAATQGSGEPYTTSALSARPIARRWQTVPMTDFMDLDRPLDAAGFDAAYEGTPPWEIGRPQPALVELVDAGLVTGPVLDVGCGTGELALLVASRGSDATGVDTSPRAIGIARQKAAERGIATVRFEVGDALDLAFADAAFETVLDSGVFHVFDDEQRARFVESIRRVLAPGGSYHLLVFSDAQPGDWGPRRVTQSEIRESFARGWRVESIEPATIDITISPEGALAWRSVIALD